MRKEFVSEEKWKVCGKETKVNSAFRFMVQRKKKKIFEKIGHFLGTEIDVRLFLGSENEEKCFQEGNVSGKEDKMRGERMDE